MARPTDNPRRHTIQFRVSDDELDVIRCAAGDQGHNLFARNLLLEQCLDRLIAEMFGTGQPGGSVHVPLIRDDARPA